MVFINSLQNFFIEPYLKDMVLKLLKCYCEQETDLENGSDSKTQKFFVLDKKLELFLVRCCSYMQSKPMKQSLLITLYSPTMKTLLMGEPLVIGGEGI